MGAGSHAQVLWSTGHGSRYQVIRVKKWSASFLRSPPEPSRVCSYPPHRTSFSPSAPSSFPSIQNSGSHRSGPASVRFMAAGSRGKFHGAGVASGPGVRRSCEQIRGGRKPGGRSGGDVGRGGSGWRSGPALRPCPPLRGVVAGRSLPSPSPRGSRWPGAGRWRGAILPLCGCRRSLLAAAGGACGKRKCAALGPTADDGRPLSFPFMAWRRGGGACWAHCPHRPPRGASCRGTSAAQGRWGGGRPAGGSARPLPSSTAGVRGPFLRPLPWPFVAGSTVEILRDDMAQ